MENIYNEYFVHILNFKKNATSNGNVTIRHISFVFSFFFWAKEESFFLLGVGAQAVTF